MKNFLKISQLILSFIILMTLNVSCGKSGGKEVLAAPADSPGQEENAKGISHFNEGHWKTAAEHFMKAVEADKNLAEAHYNLAIALHKQGNHGDASKRFKHAYDLAPKNPAIAESDTLKSHLNMKKSY